MAHNIAITGMLLSVYRLSTASYSDARMQKKSIGKSFSNPIIVVYWPAVLRTYNSCIGWRLWRESGIKLKLVSSSAVCTSVPRRRDPPVFEPWGSRSSLLSIIVITDRAYPVAAAHVWYELLRHVTSPPSLRVASRLTFFWPFFSRLSLMPVKWLVSLSSSVVLATTGLQVLDFRFFSFTYFVSCP